MQVKLTNVYVTDKDKEGNLLMSKAGKPYTRMSIKTEEHGDRWISGFKNKGNESWKQGDTVEVIIKENGQYLNFDTPKPNDVNNEKLEDIMKMLTEIKLDVKAIKERTKRNVGEMSPDEVPQDDEMPDFNKVDNDEINPEDIPF